MPGLARALANALLGALETRRHLVFENLALLQAFFLDILAGEMSEDERRERGFTFINTDEAPQGAFYTVGWKMEALVEEAEGRDVVIRSVCDPRELLVAYSRIASEAGKEPENTPTLWSEALGRPYRRPIDGGGGSEQLLGLGFSDSNYVTFLV